MDAFVAGQTLTLRGRVVREDPEPRDADSGFLTNVRHTIDALHVVPVVGENVKLRFADNTAIVRTDDFGFFSAEMNVARHDLALFASYFATLLPTSRWIASRAAGDIHDFGKAPYPLFVVSDFDDTVVHTHVRNKVRMLREVLGKNSTQLSPVAGAAAAYDRVRPLIDGIFFLSGSPYAFWERIRNYLTTNEFPRGPTFLKVLGRDSVVRQKDHKGSHLQMLVARYPNAMFLLIGDDGERDPEIYKAFRKEHPQNVIGIVIRRTDLSEPAGKRFSGIHTVDHFEENTLVEYLRSQEAKTTTPPLAQE